MVTDNRGITDTESITISVLLPDEAPTAAAEARPNEGESPLEVTFTGRGSDFDGYIAKFEWDFEGDGTYDYESTAGGSTTRTYMTRVFTIPVTVSPLLKSTVHLGFKTG